MSLRKSLLTAATLSLLATGSAQADISATAQLAARACINAMTGQPQNNGFLLSNGFQQQGRWFTRRASNLGLTGHTDRAGIQARSDGCEFRYGTDRGASAAFSAFQDVFRQNGFREVIISSGGRQVPGFEMNGTIISLFATNGSSSGSYNTRIYASIR